MASLPAALEWGLSAAALRRYDALAAAHLFARAGALPPPAIGALQPAMRRGLLALPALADVQRLCAECGLGGGGDRAALHASVLGLTPAELAGLGDEDSDGGG